MTVGACMTKAPLQAVAAEVARRRVGSAVTVNDQAALGGAGVVGVLTAVDPVRALVEALRAPPATAA